MDSTERINTYEVILEIKSNGSHIVSKWKIFRFILKDQELSPYLIEDNNKPKGVLSIQNCKASKTDEYNLLGKKFAFKVISETNQYIFNAMNEESRERTITLLNFASQDTDWYNPFTDVDSSSKNKHEIKVSNNLNSNMAILKISSLFKVIHAKRMKIILASKFPEVYRISIDKINNILSNYSQVVAYVSGLAMKKETEDIFNGKHTETTTICMSKTPLINLNSSHKSAALVASDTTLSFLCISIVSLVVSIANELQEDVLGIVFIPLSDIPLRNQMVKGKLLKYTPHKVDLKLEPYLTPDFSSVISNKTSSSTTVVASRRRTFYGGINSTNGAATTTVNHTHHYSKHDANDKMSEGSQVDNKKDKTNRRASLTRDVSGSISITIHTPDPLYSMCGWLNKKSGNTLNGSDTFKPYWFILMHGEISYYSQSVSPGSGNISMENPKKVISCKDVTSLSLVDRKFISIQFTLPGSLQSYEWKLKLLNPQPGKKPVEIAANGRMWLRKLMRCCPQIIDPTLELASKASFNPSRDLSSIFIDKNFCK